MATFTISRANLLGLASEKVELLNRGETSFKHDLQEITEGVQADRTAALQEARALQLAAQLLLQAEGNRIAAFAPDDLRVAALAGSAQLALSRAEFLDNEAALASVRVPMVKKTEALLHGRITDDLNRAAGPVTVTLVDAQGAPVAGVAPVEADSAGYYALVVPAEVAAQLPADSKLGIVLGQGGQSTPPRTEAIHLASGVVQLQDIKLGDEELRQLNLRVGSFVNEIVSPRTRAAPSPAPATAKASRSAAAKSGKAASGKSTKAAPARKGRSTR